MSKNKKKKNIFQGMEHLKTQDYNTFSGSTAIEPDKVGKNKSTIVIKENNDFNRLRKELLQVLLIFLILFSSLLLLALYNSGSYIEDLSSKLAGYFIS